MVVPERRAFLDAKEGRPFGRPLPAHGQVTIGAGPCEPALLRAPGRSRTRNLMGRNHLLYPVELQGRGTSSRAFPSFAGLCQTMSSLVAVAQLVRAPGCDPGGRGFESRQPPSVCGNQMVRATGRLGFR